MKKQVKEKVEETGLMFLKDNIKSTGKSIEYTHFEMINYLTSNSLLTIQKKKHLKLWQEWQKWKPITKINM